MTISRTGDARRLDIDRSRCVIGSDDALLLLPCCLPIVLLGFVGHGQRTCDVYGMVSLPQDGRHVLGANLNCSESHKGPYIDLRSFDSSAPGHDLVKAHGGTVQRMRLSDDIIGTARKAAGGPSERFLGPMTKVSPKRYRHEFDIRQT
jgi:hypothetical protein